MSEGEPISKMERAIRRLSLRLHGEFCKREDCDGVLDYIDAARRLMPEIMKDLNGPDEDEPSLERDHLWRDTVPGGTFTTKFSVLLLDVPTHRHNGGQAFVSYNDAVRVAHELNKARGEQR